MFATMNVIIDDVLNELGLVPGSGVQTYTEPQIINQVQRVFIALSEKRFWAHQMRNTAHVLDGTEGVSTTAFVGVLSYDDIEWVRYIPYEPHTNMAKLSDVIHQTGMREGIERIHFSEVLANKIFRVFPNTFAQPIMVRARRWPVFPFTSDTVVPFDSLAMSYMVSSNLLAKDSLNPGDAARVYSQFEARYTDIIANENGRVSYYGSNSSETFTVAGT